MHEPFFFFDRLRCADALDDMETATLASGKYGTTVYPLWQPKVRPLGCPLGVPSPSRPCACSAFCPAPAPAVSLRIGLPRRTSGCCGGNDTAVSQLCPAICDRSASTAIMSSTPTCRRCTVTVGSRTRVTNAFSTTLTPSHPHTLTPVATVVGNCERPWAIPSMGNPVAVLAPRN